ncbi:hypothetical protein L211DRAFT_415092 [Terfezia boudieri ATCC MYA-4762]|uniref:Uncharacterized protein n=1 Tax=Terfezia boudieri ATCC MYA-4762 TaxID=1051890 RepID=A0A3N4LFP7_9PEZI|nr:hypothetical protein L211DRAFT_415092 [Terfezia boudieri ATCC MYA-4762]
MSTDLAPFPLHSSSRRSSAKKKKKKKKIIRKRTSEIPTNQPRNAHKITGAPAITHCAEMRGLILGPEDAGSEGAGHAGCESWRSSQCGYFWRKLALMRDDDCWVQVAWPRWHAPKAEYRFGDMRFIGPLLSRWWGAGWEGGLGVMGRIRWIFMQRTEDEEER